MNLSIGEQEIAINGRRASAMLINGTLPGPLVRLREGQDAVIRVTNQIANVTTSIHWHGLLLPFRMDGVPGVSYPASAPARRSPIGFRFGKTAPIGITATRRGRNNLDSMGRWSSRQRSANRSVSSANTS